MTRSIPSRDISAKAATARGDLSRTLVRNFLAGCGALSFVLAASILIGASAPAQAQVGFGWWRDRGIVYEERMPELIGRRGIRRIIGQYGYRVRGPLLRNGRVYVVDVRDRRGRSLRVIVDGIEGDIVQVFRNNRPRPPGRIDRRYSRSPSVDQPRNLGRGVKPDRRKARKTVRKPKSKKSIRTARKPSRVIVRKPLAPLAAPSQPDVTARPVVKPASKPAIKPADKRGPVAAQPKQAAVPAEPVAAPRIVPEKPVTAERKMAVPEKPENTSVVTRSIRQILPPPIEPAPVKIDAPKKSAAISKPRIVGPPIHSQENVPAVKPKAAEGSKNTRALVAPLDNPGKRRDIEKPVAVAPLQ